MTRDPLMHNRARHESTWQANEARVDAGFAFEELGSAMRWMQSYYQRGFDDSSALNARASLERALAKLEEADRRCEAAEAVGGAALEPMRLRPTVRSNVAPAPKSARATIRAAKREVDHVRILVSYAVQGWNLWTKEHHYSTYRQVRDPETVRIERSRLDDLIDRLQEIPQSQESVRDESGARRAREEAIKAAVEAVRKWDWSF